MAIVQKEHQERRASYETRIRGKGVATFSVAIGHRKCAQEGVMKRTLAIAAALLVAVVGAAPVQADPPEQTEEPIFGVFPDFEHGLAGFWNITREDYCAWQASGFAGPPPVIELVPVVMHETGQGAVVASYNAMRPIELWTLDGSLPGGPCLSTDEHPAPWATGPVHVAFTDNDLFASMTRMNVFGDRGQGTVFDADGAAWHYSWTTRILFSQDGEVTFAVDNSTLKKKGS